MTFVARLFGLLEHHVIVARRAHGFALQSPEGAHVRDELPHLVVGQPAPEGRHPARTSLYDRRENVLWRAAVNPLVIGERRTDAPAAVGMATRAVHLIEQPLPLGDGIGVVLVRVP